MRLGWAQVFCDLRLFARDSFIMFTKVFTVCDASKYFWILKVQDQAILEIVIALQKV